MWACFSGVIEIGMEIVVGYARWDHKDHLGLVLVGRGDIEDYAST